MTEDADAGAGVGETLANARTELGLSVADIARQLKLAVRQIEAMEQDRFDELPGGTFARGMVRSYARMLKLDAETLVGRMAARVAEPDNTDAVVRARRPIPITDNDHRSNLIYAALSVAILVVIAAVVVEWQRERTAAARLTFVPAAHQPATVVPPQQLAAASPVEISPAQADSPAAAPSTAGVAAEGVHRIVLSFERESWVQIREAGGRILTSQLNPAGSERTVEGRAPFEVVIGNAQFVHLAYDDQPVDLTPHVKVEVARLTLE